MSTSFIIFDCNFLPFCGSGGGGRLVDQIVGKVRAPGGDTLAPAPVKQTDACENITFPVLRLCAIKM